jgi:hypothetical protein
MLIPDASNINIPPSALLGAAHGEKLRRSGWPGFDTADWRTLRTASAAELSSILAAQEPDGLRQLLACLRGEPHPELADLVRNLASDARQPVDRTIMAQAAARARVLLAEKQYRDALSERLVLALVVRPAAEERAGPSALDERLDAARLHWFWTEAQEICLQAEQGVASAAQTVHEPSATVQASLAQSRRGLQTLTHLHAAHAALQLARSALPESWQQYADLLPDAFERTQATIHTAWLRVMTALRHDAQPAVLAPETPHMDLLLSALDRFFGSASPVASLGTDARAVSESRDAATPEDSPSSRAGPPSQLPAQPSASTGVPTHGGGPPPPGLPLHGQGTGEGGSLLEQLGAQLRAVANGSLTDTQVFVIVAVFRLQEAIRLLETTLDGTHNEGVQPAIDELEQEKEKLIDAALLQIFDAQDTIDDYLRQIGLPGIGELLADGSVVPAAQDPGTPRVSAEERLKTLIRDLRQGETRLVPDPGLDYARLAQLSQTGVTQLVRLTIDGVRVVLAWESAVRNRQFVHNPSSVYFEEPLALRDAMQRLHQLQRQYANNLSMGFSLMERELFSQETLRTLEGLGNTPILGTIGRGFNSVVLVRGDGTVLKVGPYLPDWRQDSAPFELPVLDSGVIRTPTGRLQWYTQPMGERRGVTLEHVRQIREQARAAGYPEPRDLDPQRTDQIVLYEGKPRLVDRDVLRPGND